MNTGPQATVQPSMSETTMTTATQLFPRPLVRPSQDGKYFSVDFRDGRTGWAKLYDRHPSGYSRLWEWEVQRAGEVVERGSTCYSAEGLLHMMQAVGANLPTEWVSLEGLEAFLGASVTQIDRDGSRVFSTALKRILGRRFKGLKFSVRCGRGTAYSWVNISPKCAGAKIVCSALDLGSCRPCGGARVAVLCRAAGVPMPRGFEVLPPAWD